MNPKKILSSIAIGAGAIVIGLGFQYVLADWTAAPSSPPSGNTPAPINVGTAGQAKNGGLTLGSATPLTTSSSSLDVENGSFIKGILTQGFALVNGTQGNGKVLESDANGLTTWVATSSLGVGGIVRVVGGTNITVTQSGSDSGVKTFTISCSGCSSGGSSSGTTVDGNFASQNGSGAGSGWVSCEYTNGSQYRSTFFNNFVTTATGNVGSEIDSSNNYKCECPGDTVTKTGTVGTDVTGATIYNYECTY
ncbi:MAG: hypothetical protein P4L61_03505 [Candidatus Pacebacteria bacterium]|nr:hypothetical protein [Candidatus Paceibacterota bacterium]